MPHIRCHCICHTSFGEVDNQTFFEIAKEVDCVQVGAIRDGEIIRRSNIACLSADDTEEMDAELQPIPIPALSSVAASSSLWCRQCQVRDDMKGSAKAPVCSDDDMFSFCRPATV